MIRPILFLSLAHIIDAVDYTLIHEQVECMSDDANLGDQTSLDNCALACSRHQGCVFFIYGTGFKSGRCYAELTASAACSEGWEADHFDFYGLGSATPPSSPRIVLPPSSPPLPPTSPPPPPLPLPPPPPPSPPLSPFRILKRDAECMSEDMMLHDDSECDGVTCIMTVEMCANKCESIEGCDFFIFGKGFKDGRCYWEKTSDASCPEGWETDEYDFYLLDRNAAPAGNKSGGGGCNGFGWWFFGMVVGVGFGIVGRPLGDYASKKWKDRSSGTRFVRTRREDGPLASADQSSFTPPMITSSAISSNA
jgi:hypothetical protein